MDTYNVTCPFCEVGSFTTMCRNGYYYPQCDNCGIYINEPMVTVEEARRIWRSRCSNEDFRKGIKMRATFTDFYDSVIETNNSGLILYYNGNILVTFTNKDKKIQLAKDLLPVEQEQVNLFLEKLQKEGRY